MRGNAISASIVFGFLACNAMAHDVDDALPTTRSSQPSQVWHDSASGEIFRGRFLSSRGDTVRIERDNGDVVTLELHDLAPDDQAAAKEAIERVRKINQAVGQHGAVKPTTAPAAAAPFDHFAPLVRTHWDDRFLYVESNGMPAHDMMVGIRAWQQQVPLPQAYTGENAWRIPLLPVPADHPVSAKSDLFRGAIALAANGVPIFNPIKNDGKSDTFVAGELDEFGGHSGRADDYHYHIAPLHLQQTLGPDLPIAYALDGYPIYGLLGEKPCPIAGDVKLDAFNGHADASGQHYHYHASKTYPYINGGMHGQVAVAGGQIDPQPHATPIRPATTPLRGATITGYTHPDDRHWTIEYTLGGLKFVEAYHRDADGSVTFETKKPDGTTETQTYRPRAESDRSPSHEQTPPANADAPPRDAPPAGGRKPWFVVHAAEMDSDHDGILTRAEVYTEIDKTCAAYDVDHDGVLTRDETRKPVRSTLGGFISQHFDEFAKGQSTDKSGVRRVVMRMFDKQDANGDGKLDADELKGSNP